MCKLLLELLCLAIVRMTRLLADHRTHRVLYGVLVLLYLLDSRHKLFDTVQIEPYNVFEDLLSKYIIMAVIAFVVCHSLS